MHDSRDSTIDVDKLIRARADDYPGHAFQRLVILISEAVNSTQFSESEDDSRIPEEHKNLVTSIVHQYGGIFAAAAEDSVTAVFMIPRQAVKSAMMIQQHLSQQNPENRPVARIGIHFGDGVISRNDVHGEAAKLAARIVRMTEGGEIAVSQQVHDLVRNMPGVRYDPFDLSDSDELKGLGLFKLKWDESADTSSGMKVLLFFKPVWILSKPEFSEDWKEILLKKDVFWGEKVEKDQTYPDKSASLIATGIETAFETAAGILSFLAGKSETGPGYTPLPLQIAMDYGFYHADDSIDMSEFKPDWSEIHPGIIHISPRALRLYGEKAPFTVEPPPRLDRQNDFHRILANKKPFMDASVLFFYQGNLVRGKNVPCFYCGTRKHLAINCPSKKMGAPSDSLENLNYASARKINRLFFDYLIHQEIRRESRDLSGMAFQALNELKYIYQLRFFSAVWDSGEDDWERVRAGRSRGRKEGGRVWLAYDCIRTSNLARAETLLNRALRENPDDYKIYCSLGYLCIERTRFREAVDFFKRALELAKTKPQAIFVLFLLNRIHYLTGDFAQAEKNIRHILMIHPRCADAMFQNILNKFKEGQSGKALANLTSFLTDYPEYYVSAMIDPELAPFNRIIHPELKRLMSQSRDLAVKIAPRAEQDMMYLEKLFGEDDQGLDEVRSSLQKIRELLESDSYLGCLDVVHYVNLVSAKSKSIRENRKKELYDLVYRTRETCEELFTLLDGVSDVNARRLMRNRLSEIRREAEEMNTLLGSQAGDRFKTAIDFSERCAPELSEMENELKKIGSRNRVKDYISTFLKSNAVLQSINICVGIALYIAKILYPKTHIGWSLQVAVFFFGAIFCILLSFGITIIKHAED